VPSAALTVRQSLPCASACVTASVTPDVLDSEGGAARPKPASATLRAPAGVAIDPGAASGSGSIAAGAITRPSAVSGRRKMTANSLS
jgi:hypothetical protein